MPLSPNFTLPPALFAEVFPFHLVLNPRLEILQAGAVIQRLSPLPLLGGRFDERFEIQHPHVAPEFNGLCQRSRALFILKFCHNNIRLRGQMLEVPSQDAIYFLGSLLVTELEELKPLGVKLKDFALHDAIADFLFLLQAKNTALSDAKKLTEALSSHQTQLEKSLKLQKNLQQKAEAANRAKSEFLANMSHELRTPLNAILGFAQVLLRGNLSPQEQADYLNIINRSGEHLLALIDDILEMSKIEAGRITYQPKNFDLDELLQSLVDFFKIKAETKQIKLELTRSPNVPQYIQTDEGKLRQVLINLLNNAIKFTEQGSVYLRVKPLDRPIESSLFPTGAIILEFAVEDTGSGIASAEISRIFEPFQQSSSGRESNEGTGLGLPIARKFVELMGGKLEVTSVVNRGSIFSFYIPIVTVKATDIEVVERPKKVIGLAPDCPIPRILIVEDNLLNRQLLSKLLTSVGLEVREAENGRDAIAIWEQWHPHLIWMDMRMPVLNGYEATKAIKSHLKGQATVIIALTASALEEERSIILSTGCDDFVRKPFRESELFSKMEKYLGLSYRYEEIQTRPICSKTPESSRAQCLKELQQMPSDWLEQLEQAAVRGFDERILELSEKIPPQSALLKATLTEWSEEFDFDAVVALIQERER